MNYIGRKVIHKAKYGEGTVVAQNGNSISVKIDSEPELIKFIAPDCFKSFLHLTDSLKELMDSLPEFYKRRIVVWLDEDR